MNASLPIASASALAVLGCAPQAPGQRETLACAGASEFSAATQLEPVGDIGGWSISATPGVMTCSEPTPDAWGCVFMGPASVRVSATESATEHLYAIADGEMGAVTVSSDGVSCSLRSAQ